MALGPILWQRGISLRGSSCHGALSCPTRQRRRHLKIGAKSEQLQQFSQISVADKTVDLEYPASPPEPGTSWPASSPPAGAGLPSRQRDRHVGGLVLYYSAYGHFEAMAIAVAEGVRGELSCEALKEVECG